MAIGSAAAREQPGNVLAAAVAALVISLLSNTWEEVGWRGFALPRLQARHSALVAALIVGALWGLWHLPLFFWKGNPMATYSFASWFVGTVALSFVYTWLYDGSKGSLFVVTIFHVLHNTFGVFVGGVSIHALTVVYCLAALLLVAVFGKENLSRQERVRAATSGYGNSCCGQDSGRGSR